MVTDDDAITRPAQQRVEVFMGAGRRRAWLREEKARIVAEIASSGDSVCAVARRHGLSPQQLFGWRRQLREAAGQPAVPEGLQFVPAMVDGLAPVDRQHEPLRCKPAPDLGLIEIDVAGVTVRVNLGADTAMLTAVVQALKAIR